MLASLLLLAVAATPTSGSANPPLGARAPSLSADGRVLTPEGIRFRLPPGLLYATGVAKGRRAWIASDADDTTAVVVDAFLSDARLSCRDEVEGVELEAFTTAGGLRACIGSAYRDDPPRVFGVALVKRERMLVTVTAIAPDEAAEDLVRFVADSVRIGPDAPGRARATGRAGPPRVDPRLVGCFRREYPVRGAPGVTMSFERCFEDDFTFTQVSGAKGFGLASTPTERAGTWGYAGGNLHLDFDDESSEGDDAALDEADLILDGARWRRL